MGPVTGWARPGSAVDGLAPPRLVASDLDGTLLRTDGSLSGRTAAAWSAAARRGHRDGPRHGPSARAGCTIWSGSSGRAARRSAATAPSSTRWPPTGSSRRTASSSGVVDDLVADLRRAVPSVTLRGRAGQRALRGRRLPGPAPRPGRRAGRARVLARGRCRAGRQAARARPGAARSRSSSPRSRRSSATAATCTSPARTGWRRSTPPGSPRPPASSGGRPRLGIDAAQRVGLRRHAQRPADARVGRSRLGGGQRPPRVRRAADRQCPPNDDDGVAHPSSRRCSLKRFDPEPLTAASVRVDDASHHWWSSGKGPLHDVCEVVHERSSVPPDQSGHRASPRRVPPTDEAMLAELGYKQELHRGMSGFSNFAVSFSIISVLAGCITSYAIAMNAGGPIAISIGLAARRRVRPARRPGDGRDLLGLPDRGRALLLGRPAGAAQQARCGPGSSGWFNFLGEVAVTAAIDYGAAVTWMALLSLVTRRRGHRRLDASWPSSCIIALHGLLNTFGVNLVKLLSNVSAWWHLVGRARSSSRSSSFVPDHHQCLSWTLHRTSRTAPAGTRRSTPSSSACSWRSTPTPASTPRRTSPRRPSTPPRRRRKGSCRSVWVSILAGWVLLVAVTAAIQDYDAALRHRHRPAARPDLHRRRRPLARDLPAVHRCRRPVLLRHGLGDGQLADVLRLLPRQRAARLAVVGPGQPAHRDADELHLAVRRLLDRADRSGALSRRPPTSPSPRSRSSASTSPTSSRSSCAGRTPTSVPGTWNLGRWSAPIGWVAVVWVGFIVILFMLPPASPITVNTFNYAPIAVLAVLVFSTVTVVRGRPGPLHA